MQSYSGEEICTECMCNRGAIPFTDFRADCAWRRTIIGDSAGYFARCRLPLHPLLSSSFAWRGFTPLDFMRVADCNGVTCIIAGSVLHPLVMSEASLGNNMDGKMATLNTQLKRFYDERPGCNRMAPLRTPTTRPSS